MSYPAISLATATAGRHRRPPKRLQTAANLPSTRIRARIIAPVTPSPPSAVLTPSIPVHRWIRAKRNQKENSPNPQGNHARHERSYKQAVDPHISLVRGIKLGQGIPVGIAGPVQRPRGVPAVAALVTPVSGPSLELATLPVFRAGNDEIVKLPSGLAIDRAGPVWPPRIGTLFGMPPIRKDPAPIVSMGITYLK